MPCQISVCVMFAKRDQPTERTHSGNYTISSNRAKVFKGLKRIDEKSKTLNRKNQKGSVPSRVRLIPCLNHLRTCGFFFTACFFTKRTSTQSRNKLFPVERSVCKTFTPITMAVAVESLKPAGNGCSMRQRGANWTAMAMSMVNNSATVNMSRGDPPSPPPNPPPSPSRTSSTKRTSSKN